MKWPDRIVAESLITTKILHQFRRMEIHKQQRTSDIAVLTLSNIHFITVLSVFDDTCQTKTYQTIISNNH